MQTITGPTPPIGGAMEVKEPHMAMNAIGVKGHKDTLLFVF